ncbi:MAG: glycosyltransferase [Polyangiaceae bacterium]
MICLLPHCAYLSETSRMAAVYKALVARGAPVCVATHGGTHEFYLERAGIPYSLLEPRMDAARCRRFVADGAGQGAPNQSMYSDDEIRAQVSAQVRFFREQGVRAVLTGFSLTSLLSTRVAGVPLAASHAGSCVPPVFQRNIMPAPSRLSPAILRALPRAWQQRLSNWVVERVKFYCGGFNRVARELGVEPVPSFAALLLADLTLVTDIPEIVGISREEMHAWVPSPAHCYRAPTKLRYTGPLFASQHGALPERVERFLSATDPRPLVYVALTSTSSRVVLAAIQAVRKAGARVLAVSTVHEIEAAQGDDLLIEPYLPSVDVMPRVALAVTAGGQGSVQTAMVSGTPLLGVPLQPEQDLNLYLIERQGAGRLLPLRQVGSTRMVELVRGMLADATYRAQAQRLKSLLEREDGAGNAAELLMRLASEGIEAV